MTLQRRQFIKWLLAGLAGLCLLGGGTLGYFFVRPDSKCHQLVKKWVRDALPYLKLNPEGLDAFAEAFQEREIEADSRTTWVVLSTYIWLYPVLTPLVRASGKGDMLDGMATLAPKRFLQSSDFFYHQADETRDIQFLAWFDPWERPCTNPFADLS